MKVAITGATGTVGTILTRRLLADASVERIVAIGHSEDRVLRYEGEFGADARVETRKGDVVDARSMTKALRGADLVYHLAAMKHVDLSEKDPYQVARVNVEGTMNVLDAAVGAGARHVVLMSTDKVVQASSLYGATKLVAERLALSEARRGGPTRINVLRSGNVLLSTGSVLEVWKRSLAARNEVRVTDPAMTRFFIGDAALGDALVAMRSEPAGVVVVPRLKAYRLEDLLTVFLKRFGRPDTRVVTVGKRAGEKLYEDLVAEDELEKTTPGGDAFRVWPAAVPDPLPATPSSRDHVVGLAELERVLAPVLAQIS